jgi:hypothetical protein
VYEFLRGHAVEQAASPRHVVPRIVVVDLQPIDVAGNPVEIDQLPAEYIRAILRVMNPNMLLEINGPTVVTDWLPLAGLEMPLFQEILLNGAEASSEHDAPSDLSTLRQFVASGILHEAAHALALHLPGVLPKNLNQMEAERLQRFDYRHWLDMLTDPWAKNESIVYGPASAKNAMKAIQTAAQQGMEENLHTQHFVLDQYALGMFCDRFAMFLYENASKIQRYQMLVGKRFGDPMAIEMLRSLEQARSDKQPDHMLLPDINLESLAQLEADLTAAESTHLYAAAFGECPVQPEERRFFDGFLDLIRDLDTRKEIMRFTKQHADTSRVFGISTPGPPRAWPDWRS